MNLLLVTVDCLRADRCGFIGHHRPTTDTLDELADSAYVFDRAIATGPQTVESFPGIFGARHSYQADHRQGNIGWKALPADTTTLGTHLSDHGYETAATATNMYLSRRENYHRGFDHFVNLDADADKSEDGDGSDDGGNDGSANMLRRSFWKLTDVVRDRLEAQSSLRNPYTPLFVAYQYRHFRSGWPTTAAEDVVDRFLDQLNGISEPFFGWTHFMDLHAPIHRRTIDRDLYPSYSYRRHFTVEAAREAHIHEPGMESLYDAALSGVDAQIHRLVEWLKREGVYDDTVLIVTADHGEALQDRGYYSHPKQYVYNELLRVPLLVRVPDEDGDRVDEPFSLAWLHELISDVLDVPRGEDFPTKTDGRDHLNPADDDDAVALSDSVLPDGHLVTAQTETDKLIAHHGGLKPQYDHKPTASYDLTSDPWERRPADAQRAPERLRRLVKGVATEPDDLRTVGTESSAEAKQRLKELGYVA